MILFECTYCGYIKEFNAKPIKNSVLRCPICGESNCWEEKTIKEKRGKDETKSTARKRNN
jgi:hypothetical protein